MTAPLRVLAVTRGHNFERNAFTAMLDALPGVEVSQVEQPAAQTFFRAENASEWDAFLMYDMPGYTFHRDHSPVDLHEPPSRFREDFEGLVAAGHGFVFLHHALASWPTWPEYSALIGGRFRFVPGDGQPDSGYRHEVDQRIRVLDRSHPITAGVDAEFALRDETYLCAVDEGVHPLLATDVPLDTTTHYSTYNAVQGRRDTNDGWSHEPGSGVVGWVKPHDTSRIAYLQFGDGPSAYGNENFRRLLTNALTWAAGASPEASP
ncbi:ThuA domain-containing protein [Gordonia amicalis]|uniref:ThuA domain-containing protein n=1 Tax=Gordonia amicalis TaxID=89053 RepID=UPI000550857F|nr:ThuA domain-containing protein [Gordonia amicalis]MCZ4653861.1 ThuA domain-containing protein [Gordonia amicalis]